MAAASHLTILAPKPRTPQTFRAAASCSAVSPVGFKKQIMGVAAGILAASLVASAAPLEANATRIEYFATFSEPSCELNFVRSGLGYCDVVVGSGEEVPFAQLINVHYTARFDDGIVFDSTYKRARPLTMRLGVGKVIKGLDQGILGGGGVPPMHVGGKRKLHIPPQLAYGPEPAGCFSGDCNIPANATLVYDVNFVNVYSGNRKE
ncbi:Photosynthetic NDH subunit of lumenal location 4, chloroplastic [Salvia divinorum]|uniref:peptidylprolyl isomerase n=1 Tax=Salvia divinorum TaxID=28513 RepID=A0ABD1IHV9_SALDI